MRRLRQLALKRPPGAHPPCSRSPPPPGVLSAGIPAEKESGSVVSDAREGLPPRLPPTLTTLAALTRPAPRPSMGDDAAARAGPTMPGGDRMDRMYDMMTQLMTPVDESNKIATETRDRLAGWEGRLSQLGLSVTNLRASSERQEAAMQDMSKNTYHGEQLTAASQKIAAMGAAHAELEAKFAALMADRASVPAAPTAASPSIENEPGRKLRKTHEGRALWADQKDDDEDMVVDDNAIEALGASGLRRPASKAKAQGRASRASSAGSAQRTPRQAASGRSRSQPRQTGSSTGPKVGRVWVAGLPREVMPAVQQTIAKTILAGLDPAIAALAHVRPRQMSRSFPIDFGDAAIAHNVVTTLSKAPPSWTDPRNGVAVALRVRHDRTLEQRRTIAVLSALWRSATTALRGKPRSQKA